MLLYQKKRLENVGSPALGNFLPVTYFFFFGAAFFGAAFFAAGFFAAAFLTAMFFTTFPSPKTGVD
jgi:hypothetical protein